MRCIGDSDTPRVPILAVFEAGVEVDEKTNVCEVATVVVRRGREGWVQLQVYATASALDREMPQLQNRHRHTHTKGPGAVLLACLRQRPDEQRQQSHPTSTSAGRWAHTVPDSP